MAERSIAVDDKTRVSTQHQREIQMGRKAVRDVCRTGVPADMIGQPIRFQAKGTEPFGDPIGGVIADQHRAATSVPIDRLDRGRFIEPE